MAHVAQRVARSNKFYNNFVILFSTEPSYVQLDRVIDAHKNWLKQDSATTQQYLAPKIISQYITAMVEMRERVTRSISTYDLHAMGTGIALLWLVSLHVT